MWIKICANTNVEDAKAAAELGADAVGFVFAASKRQVTAEQVARIVPMLPDALEKIGVFDSQDAIEIAQIVRTAGLTGVQLHGGFNLDLARRVKVELGAGMTVIQTVHWMVDGDSQNAAEVLSQLRQIAGEAAIDRVLVDSKLGKTAGGTGVAFDWNAARAVFAESGLKLILAGGLRPENVTAAIKTLHPWGVDVASGVEAHAGLKDQIRVKQFIDCARELQAE